jgi:small subunit ribosomal protein S13
MLRLMGHVIPDNKSIWIGLTTIFGIGRERSLTILNKIGVDFMVKVKNLSDEHEKMISEELQNYLLENDLKRDIMTNIKRLKEIKCYRGMRHNL